MKKRWFIIVSACIVQLFLIIQSEPGWAQSNKKFEQSRRSAFRVILPEKLLKIYDAISDTSAQSKWESRYWKALDPTPTTPENEYYEEHFRRLTFARKHYSNLVPPFYFDDRGKYYIKYGPPDDFVESVGIGEGYRSNVTWAYYSLNLFVDFVEKEFYGYQEVNDLSEAVRGQPDNRKATIASQLYAERINIDQRYTVFQNILNSKNEQSMKDQGISSRYKNTQSINRFFSEVGKIVEAKSEALSLAPPHEYHHDYHAEPLSASLKCANFRGEGKKTRIEFYYAVPLKEITFVPGQTYPLESKLEKHISIFDHDFREVVNKAEPLQLAAKNLNQIQDMIYVNQDEEILQPGLYNIALRLENPQGNRLAILKAQLQAKDFSGDNLLLSDLELASQIHENASGRHLKKNNIQIVPYLPRTIRSESPLYVYFEIYNLNRDNKGYTHYEVNYTVRTMEGTGNTNPIAKIASFLVGGKKTQSVATSFDGSGTSDFQQIYLLMDFSTSPPGKTDFLVKVTDRVSGQQANSKVSFVLK